MSVEIPVLDWVAERLLKADRQIVKLQADLDREKQEHRSTVAQAREDADAKDRLAAAKERIRAFEQRERDAHKPLEKLYQQCREMQSLLRTRNTKKIGPGAVDEFVDAVNKAEQFMHDDIPF